MSDSSVESKDMAQSGLGERLRRLRQESRLSLADVSKKTGIASSTLSRIENNRLSLTYEKLLQLARGLDVDLTELISDANGKNSPAPSGRRAFTPSGNGRIIETKNHYYRYLCTELTGKIMTPIIGKVEATNIRDAGGFLHHDGEELVFVLTGTLEFHTEFYEPLRVEAGGCVYFDSKMGHAFVAADGPVTFLSVCSGSDQELGGVLDSRGTTMSKLSPPQTEGVDAD